jgi:ornithine cyclodeaminase
MKTLLLSQHDVPALLPMPEAIDAMELAFRALAAGEATLPLRSVIALPGERGFFAVMPATLGAAPAPFGLKAIGVFPSNEGTPHDSHPGAILLFEPMHGRLAAVIDASSVTAIRTAAVSGLATRLLARPGAATLALLGSGTQARSHLAAMLAVRPLRKVRVWSRSLGHAAMFVDRARREHRVEVDSVQTAREAVEGADLVCTVTASPTPVLEGAWLAPGAHVNAVGASRPTTRELDGVAMARARLYVDRRESALVEAGDFILARAEGHVTDDSIVAELADLVAGRAPGRASDGEITLFKSLGLAIEDLAAAQALYAKARATGAGVWLEFGGARNGT